MMSLFTRLFRNPEPQSTSPKIERKRIVKAYQAHCFPVLEANGFDTFKSSAAWRYREKVIDAVDLTFFPAYKTRTWDLKNFNFALSGGVFYPFVPEIGPIIPTGKDGRLLPPEIACIDRMTPNRRMKQKGNKIPNIWNIAADGANLDAVMNEVRIVLEEELIPHLDAQGDLRKRLNEMLEAHAKLPKVHPGGYYNVGFFAFELGEWELARENLHQALATGFFGRKDLLANPTEDQIRAAIQKAEATLGGVASA